MPTTYTPGEMVDHYEIIRMLGQGGMNHVYPAPPAFLASRENHKALDGCPTDLAQTCFHMLYSVLQITLFVIL